MGMLRPRFLLLLCTLAVSLHAGSRESAFQGRALIGEGVWSRVVRIHNERAGAGSRYPAEFHGLVVAFEGILWLYTEFDGTQTLSQYAGRLSEDQANLGPLLRAVEPGLTRFEDVTDNPPAKLTTQLPYPCFLACVARWRELQRLDHPPQRARLIAYYVAAQRQGHMVLQYWRDGDRYVYDPEKPREERALAPHVGEAPLAVAKAVYAYAVRGGPVRASHLDLRPEEPLL